MAKTLVLSKSEKLLDAFKEGVAFSSDTSTRFTQSVTPKGYWLLIEDTSVEDNATYRLSHKKGLVFECAGVEI